jgi:hypothetical protein
MSGTGLIRTTIPPKKRMKIVPSTPIRFCVGHFADAMSWGSRVHGMKRGCILAETESEKWTSKDYCDCQIIGRGGTGTVLRAKLTSGGNPREEVALKRIAKDRLKKGSCRREGRELEALHNEVLIHSS